MKTLLVVVCSILVGIAIGVGNSVAEFGWFSGPKNLEQLLSVSQDVRQPDLAPADAPQPRVVVDPSQYDFGSMDRGAKKTHQFIFTNRGTAALKLVAGDTTCKCTLSELAQDEIPPGESAPVTLEWVAKVDGSDFRQTATILTNDPARPRVQLTVTGRITDAVRIEPADIVLSSIVAGSERTAVVRFLSFIEDNFQILNYRFAHADTGPFFEFVEQEIPDDELQASKAKSGKRLTITIKPGLPLGSFHQELELVTNLPGTHVYTIPIRGRISGELSIIGLGWNRDRGILSLGTVERDRGKQARLLVMVRGDHASGIEITVDKVSPSALQVTLGTPKPIKGGRVVQVPLAVEVPRGTRPMVHLGIQPSDPSRKGGLGEIILKTNHPRAKELRLKVRFAVGA